MSSKECALCQRSLQGRGAQVSLAPASEEKVMICTDSLGCRRTAILQVRKLREIVYGPTTGDAT